MAGSSSSSELLPSSYDGDYWIYASNKTSENCMAPGENCGKWLIFISADQVDAEWEKVRQATEVGQLGFQSKVATAKDTPLRGGNNNNRVICIYTYDWTDEVDVMRVRESLRKLGFTKKLCYKADQDTYAGKLKILVVQCDAIARTPALYWMKLEKKRYMHIKVHKSTLCNSARKEHLDEAQAEAKRVSIPVTTEIMKKSSWSTMLQEFRLEQQQQKQKSSMLEV